MHDNGLQRIIAGTNQPANFRASYLYFQYQLNILFGATLPWVCSVVLSQGGKSIIMVWCSEDLWLHPREREQILIGSSRELLLGFELVPL